VVSTSCNGRVTPPDAMLPSRPHRTFVLFLLFSTSVARVALRNHTAFIRADSPNLNLTRRQDGGTGGATIVLTVGAWDEDTKYPGWYSGLAIIGNPNEPGHVEISCIFDTGSKDLVVSHSKDGIRFIKPDSSQVVADTDCTAKYFDTSWFEMNIAYDAFTVGGFTIPKSSDTTEKKDITQYYGNVKDFYDPIGIKASTCGMAFSGSFFSTKLAEAGTSEPWVLQMSILNLIPPQFAFDLGREDPVMYLGSEFTDELFKEGSFFVLDLNPTSNLYQYDSLMLTFGPVGSTQVLSGVFDSGCALIVLPQLVFAEVLDLLHRFGVTSAAPVLQTHKITKRTRTFMEYDCIQPLPEVSLSFVTLQNTISVPFTSFSIQSYSAFKTSDGIKRCILSFEDALQSQASIGLPFFLSQLVGFTMKPTRQIKFGPRA